MMLIRSGRPLFTPSSPFSSALKNPLKPTPTSITRRLRSTSANMSIEHLVLFKVKPDTDSRNLSAMIDGLNGLTSQIDQLLHLSAGPIHRNRSNTQFTHLLHSRYKSKDDLAAYSSHPAHVSVVKENVLPFCDDIMAVDWIAKDVDGPIGPGSAMRITLLKLKEDTDKDEVLKIVRGEFDKVVQSSVGENFSPARAKGFSVASLAVYEGIEDLEEANDSKKKEVLESYKQKVRPYIDEVVDVESAADSDAVWERFIPYDYHEVVGQSEDDNTDNTAAVCQLVGLSKKQMFLKLSEIPLIDSGLKSFFLDKWSGKKCYMISVRDLGVVWGYNPSYWKWMPLPKSRFPKVAELCSVCWLEIHGKIESSLLSVETNYAAYLIFKFTEVGYGFDYQPAEVTVGISGCGSCTKSIYLDSTTLT